MNTRPPHNPARHPTLAVRVGPSIVVELHRDPTTHWWTLAALDHDGTHLSTLAEGTGPTPDPVIAEAVRTAALLHPAPAGAA